MGFKDEFNKVTIHGGGDGVFNKNGTGVPDNYYTIMPKDDALKFQEKKHLHDVFKEG